MHSFKPRLIPSTARPGMWYCQHFPTNTLGWGMTIGEAYASWLKEAQKVSSSTVLAAYPCVLSEGIP